VQADPQRRASFVVHCAIASFYHKSFPALGSASQGVRIKGGNMPCNAWNHPPGCDCGWGGQGNPDNLIHGGYSNINTSSYHQGYVSRSSSFSYNWLYEGSITFQTTCWWCGQEVYFHRNENGGCVLFDELGYPWQVHSCWEENREQQSEATNVMLNNYKEYMKRVKLDDFQFSKNIPKSNNLNGFFIGFDLESRLIATTTKYHDKNRYFRYFVFKTEKGEYLKILASEKKIQKIFKFAYSNIKINIFQRNKQVILELVEISSLKLNSEEKNTVKNNQSIKSFLVDKWTHQMLIKKS